ncbi:Zona pellucida-like domain-containing protein 1 [Bagarius yarrelli]|uniref:Zona pellucida-like domain-containing protein 1 n=1 Tax=Bagarius yarrelli TaxID=175774 RepID=A0A556UZV6_BAGYA|nr:Zona pellucida-like domain-containing protein 1 [Bagarius yarrelli]
MWRALIVCVITLTVHSEALTGSAACKHHSTFRQAANGDITVTCGTDSIYLSILLCPVYYSGYNESLIALNGKFTIAACYGIVDLKASAPVLRFNFSTSAEEMFLCDNSLENRQYTQPLKIPKKGLQLKTRIYVQVKATNLTNRCRHDGQTVVYLNGVSQEARFSFEAFRFVEGNNNTFSTFYLHCVTRLCENSTCSSMIPVAILLLYIEL